MERPSLKEQPIIWKKGQTKKSLLKPNREKAVTTLLHLAVRTLGTI